VPTLGNALVALVRRDIRLVVRHRFEIANPVLFFIIVVTLFPFGVGSDPAQLALIGSGIVWVAAPLLGILLNMSVTGQLTLLAALALGTPTLSLIGAVGMALTVGVKRGGLLLTLLVLPLYVPVLIFGASVVLAAEAGLPTAGHFYALGAMAVLALSLAPLATSAALRISLN